MKNRWTRAAGALKESPPATAGGTDTLVRPDTSGLNEIAPPRQLNRWASFFSMKTVIYTSVLFSLLFVSSHKAVACRCGMPTVKAAFSYSTIVFSGTVDAIESDGVTFTINQLWKGAASRQIKVYVRDLRTTCDPGVAVGRTLLVYAYRGGSSLPLMAAYCRRTRVLTKRDAETKELDGLRSSAHRRRPNKSLDASGGRIEREPTRYRRWY